MPEVSEVYKGVRIVCTDRMCNKKPYRVCVVNMDKGRDRRLRIGDRNEQDTIAEMKRWIDQQLDEGLQPRPSKSLFPEKLPTWQMKKAFDRDQSYTMAILGSTKSGKTTFLVDLLKHIHGMFDLCILFSNSSHAEIYNPLRAMENMCIYDHFIDKVVVDLYKINKETNNSMKILCILDDEVNNKNNKVMKNMFTVFRNSNISTIFSGQDWSFISKSNRNNANYVFIFKQNSSEGLRDVCDKFLLGSLEYSPKKKTETLGKCSEFVKKNTQDHGMIVLDILNDYQMYQYRCSV